MESFVVERREAGEFARSCRAGQTCTCNACTQQNSTGQEELAYRGSAGSGDFFTRRHKTGPFKIESIFDDHEEEFDYDEAKDNEQNKMKSCPTSYLIEKIACHCWRFDASCC